MTTLSLTSAQKEAIEHVEGPLLIVAGPGAGKTRVLVERVIYLIKERTVDPKSILVTTFTVKAAEELKNRLTKEGLETESMQISTIHSFCSDLLKEYSDYHELGATFDVLDEEMQLMYLRANFYHLRLNEVIRMGEISSLTSFFNKCTENCIDPDVLIEEINETFPDKENYAKICVSYREYLNNLKKDHKIDFPGLQKIVFRILTENQDLLNNVRDRFDFILVDEYQDTNPIQDKFFELIAKPKCNICVVGDEDQSIYAFRGATVCNFVKFPEKFKNTKIVKLDRNFRSTSNITTVSDKFMKDYRSFPKEIKTCRDSGNQIVLLKSTDVKDEARNVVKFIKDLKENGLIPHYGYVALLFRSVKYHAHNIINELKINDIPYSVTGDGAFLKRDEIRTMLYLLSYLDPPNFNSHLKREWGSWWNITLFGTEMLNLSEETINSLDNLKDVDISSFITNKDFSKVGITNTDDILKLKNLNLIKKGLKIKKKTVLTLFYDILKISGYLKRLLDDETKENRNKLLNLAKLSTIISKYEYINKKPSVKDFLWYVYLLPQSMQYDEEILEDLDSVKIMTVHQAKGLEFPVVIIGSVIKNRFPKNQRSQKDIVPIPENLLMSNIISSEKEERRLFYVAMTRAQDDLVISTADKINVKRVGYSPYVSEILEIENCVDSCQYIKEKCLQRDIEKNEPVNLSYSSINAYNLCPFMYKMVYEYGFSYPASYMQNYGAVIHNCLHKLHLAIKKKEFINEEKIENIVERCWTRMHESEVNDQNLKKLVQVHLSNYYENMKDYIKEVVSTEEPFSINVGDMVIKGRTDLIIQNKDDELELIDFKAREQAGIEKTTIRLQLKMYEYALKEKYKLDKLCAYTFKDNEKTYFHNKKEEMNEFEGKLHDVCDNITKENFYPNKSKFCSLCIFKFCC
ncbi:MAG: ATP-dependent DNA helicase [Methanobacterium sp.]